MNVILRSAQDLNDKYVNDLVDILNNDKKLAQELGGVEDSISCHEFLSYNKEWADKNKAKIFAIILNNAEAIGLISLSRINKKSKKARVGYWITSKYWNCSYTSQAFGQLLSLAKENNIKFVLSTISKENKKSKAIWEKFNAKFKEEGNNFVSEIEL